MENNCLGCLFSEDSTASFLLNDLFKNKYMMSGADSMKCGHENSPYYGELVFGDTICRLYVDAKEYFKMKDRKEYIDKLKDNIQKKK